MSFLEVGFFQMTQARIQVPPIPMMTEGYNWEHRNDHHKLYIIEEVEVVLILTINLEQVNFQGTSLV